MWLTLHRLARCHPWGGSGHDPIAHHQRPLTGKEPLMSNEQQKSGFDKNTIIALVLCAAIWFGWQSYLERKYPEAMHPTTVPSVQKITPDQTAKTTGDVGGAKENQQVVANEKRAPAPKGPRKFLEI